VIARILACLTPTRWLRAPRPTARLRLTLLYGVLFLLSGAALVAVTYLLAVRATTLTVLSPKGPAVSATRYKPTFGLGSHTEAGNHVVHLTPSEMTQQQAQLDQLHDAAMRRLLIGSGITLGVVAVISIALGWLMAGRVLGPVRTINAAARRISAINLDERLNLDGPDDEFRELAANLDNLLDRLQASFDSQKRFVANASHELRTPLTLDRALLERALRKTDPTQESWRTTCERLLASSQQQDRLIEGLLTLARSDTALAHPECCDLKNLVDGILLSPELETDNTGPHVHTRLNPTRVGGDPRLLERLIRNLIDNAIQHNTPNGLVEVSTHHLAGRGVLSVANTGPVVRAGEIERLLQPFQRAGTERTTHSKGLGLGLSIVHAIATAHNAELSLTPRPEGGLLVHVSFPEPASDHKPRSDTPPSNTALTNMTTRRPMSPTT
jgi:signal transduction histidine kinase